MTPTAAPPAITTLRSPRDIAALDRAAALAWRAARAGLGACVAGATTAEVGERVGEVIRAAGARPVFEGYRPAGAPSAFAAAACVSVGEDALHAPPGPRTLVPGDLVTVDAGVELEGWIGDVAESGIVAGAPGEELHLQRRLLRAARRAVAVAVRAARPGARWGEVARAVRATVAPQGLTVLAGYAGHGVGRTLHEPPRAAYETRIGGGGDFLLLPGMVFTIEPIVLAPPGRSHLAADGWTVRTSDGSPACHVERMIAVTRRGARVLGLPGRCFRALRGL